MTDHATAIPLGSWVLVTGTNGFLASHIVKQFLDRGFKVRGTVRDTKKTLFLTEELFKSQADAGNFEVVELPDLEAKEPVNAAMKDVVAIVHVAWVLNFDPNPNNIIPLTVSQTLNLLRAGKESGRLIRFVLCTSGLVAYDPQEGSTIHATHDMWNDAAVQAAWAPPPYSPERGLNVYIASKIEAEKAMWKFAEEEAKAGSPFVANSVASGFLMGKVLHEGQRGSKTTTASTVMWIRDVYDGKPVSAAVRAAMYVNVEDEAVIQVAAVLDPDIKNARLHAYNYVVNWRMILKELRQLFPGRKVADDPPDNPRFTVTTEDHEITVRLLKKWANQDGYRPLSDSLRDCIITH